jgi:hypothetical protein
MKHLHASLILLLAACTPTVQTTTGGASSGASANTQRIAADVQTLSSDAFLGRGPATRGEELATNYLRDRLIAAGVQPGGPN